MSDFERCFETFCDDLKRLVVPHKTNLEKIRIGQEGDGGYVICDIPDVKYDALYSYGSDDNIKFEKSFYEKYNVDSYVYDHTIDKITDKPDYIHFFKEGVWAIKNEQMDTIENQMKKNGHSESKNLFMQMDIEGCEFAVLTHSDHVLENFSQIIVEFHFGIDLPFNNFINKKTAVLNTLEILNKHFICTHVHANNCVLQPWFDINFPRFFEVTYVRKDLVSDYTVETEPFPTIHDFPNNSNKPEMKLDWWTLKN
jgi:hypothetical protein